MNHIILEEINVADWMKRVMMWTKATYSHCNGRNHFDFLWGVFFISQIFGLIFTIWPQNFSSQAVLCWSVKCQNPLKINILSSRNDISGSHLKVMNQGRCLSFRCIKETKPSIISNCLKVAWRTQVRPSSGETGGLREVLLHNRLSLWYLLNVIINTVI